MRAIKSRHYFGRRLSRASMLALAMVIVLAVTSAFGMAKSAKTSSFSDDKTETSVLDLQTLHCPWFSVADDLVSFISLKNTTNSEMNVYLTIRFGSNEVEDGSYESTDAILLGPQDSKVINIRPIVQQHRKLFKQANTGGLELLYFGKPTDLIAKTSMISNRHHQSFDIPFVNPQLSTTSILDSVWWFIGGDYRTFVEIKNTTNEDVLVTLLLRHGKDGVTEQTFAMPARQSRAIDIKDFKPLLDGDVTGSAELRHTGGAGAIVANSTTMSRRLGMSFDSPFIPRTMIKD